MCSFTGRSIAAPREGMYLQRYKDGQAPAGSQPFMRLTALQPTGSRYSRLAASQLAFCMPKKVIRAVKKVIRAVKIIRPQREEARHEDPRLIRLETFRQTAS